jgi:phosphomannomutase
MFIIRYSQNGPYITIKFEAKTEEEYEKLKKYINTLLHKYPEIDWENEIKVNAESLE